MFWVKAYGLTHIPAALAAEGKVRMSNSIPLEERKLSPEAWARHSSKKELISNSAVRPDKSKSMLAAIVADEKDFADMKTGDGDSVLELIRNL
jgi:hypothetical protein